MATFTFPEINKFKAKELLDLNFDIKDYQNQLYVDFGSVRGDEQFEEIKFILNIGDDELASVESSYTKIIFSGHRGCGKTLELRRYNQYLFDPKRFFSILVEMENEVDLFRFRPEDFYVLIIAKLIESLKERNIDFDNTKFARIAEKWISNREVKKELTDTFGLDISGEISIGASFWSFFSAKNAIKNLFSTSSKTIETIRTEITKNERELVKELNSAIDGLRAELQNQNKGKDILLIIDGSEKMRDDTYNTLFIMNAEIISSLKIRMICAVPINSFYQISNSSMKDYFEQLILPMIKIDEQSIPLLKMIITKRIDQNTFFENDVLEYCVQKSGGNPRQLLRIVLESLKKSRGSKITLQHTEDAVKKLGQDMFDGITEKHIEKIKNKNYLTGEPEVQELLVFLRLLKYNGMIAVNPLLEGFV
ncbi:MAG: hypothetical protein GY799_15990 [Desulfobulbaceae bacterium]|nr:hypothetical protein [Desulfobulbaceae bacterium]